MTGTARHEPSRRPVLPEAITSTGVVAIGRGVGPQRAVEIGDALLEAGAVALGVGGWLTRDHGREVIERRAREIVETVRRARTERAA